MQDANSISSLPKVPVLSVHRWREYYFTPMRAWFSKTNPA
jgi:hypothetical protein